MSTSLPNVTKQISIGAHNFTIGSTRFTLVDGDYDVFFPSVAGAIQLSSTDAADTGAGVGAQTVRVVGLDGNWDQVEETITMNGQAASLASVGTFLRVNRLEVIAAGNTNQNVGTVYCSVFGTGLGSGVPVSSIQHSMFETQCLSHTGVHSTPRNTKVFFHDFLMSNDAAASKAVELIIRIRTDPSLVFKLFAHNHFNTQLNMNFRSYNTVPERSDILIEAETPTGSVSCHLFINGLQKVTA